MVSGGGELLQNIFPNENERMQRLLVAKGKQPLKDLYNNSLY